MRLSAEELGWGLGGALCNSEILLISLKSSCLVALTQSCLTLSEVMSKLST